MEIITTATTPTATPSAARRKIVYTVIEREGLERPVWVRIGVGWLNRDDSLNIRLDALPVNGQLHIRDYDPERDGPKREATEEKK
jgi:hypothetical protein